MYVRLTIALLFVALFAADARADNSALDIGSRRELFIDDYLIDRLEGGARRVLQHPQPRETAILHDAPWEGNASVFHTVFKDGPLYRMYYRGATFIPHKDGTSTNWQNICYAQSTDGIHWDKPLLGICEFQGSKENSIILLNSHTFMAFKDDNPECKPEELYKANDGFYGYTSPDALHWTKAAYFDVKGKFDSLNTTFYDPARKQYLFYFRDTKDGVRDIRLATSPDFRTWTKDNAFLDYGGAPVEELYINNITPYFRAPHLYIGTPTRFMKDRAHNPCDTLLMVSRDGLHFSRWNEAFVRPGLKATRWGQRNGFVAHGIVPTASLIPDTPDELSFYAIENYQDIGTTQMRRYTLRMDGFVSINAPASGGELITRPLIFKGTGLELNYATSAGGSLRVELQDADGKPIPKFTLDESTELFGDSVETFFAWKSKASLAPLAGTSIRLRIVLHDADLYAIRFR